MSAAVGGGRRLKNAVFVAKEGEGRVLGCFCARLLVSWLCVSLKVFVGLANKTHLTCAQVMSAARSHLLGYEEAMSKTSLGRAKVNSLQHA